MRLQLPIAGACVFFIGCTTQDITVIGWVREHHGDKAGPFEAATVSILDSGGVEASSATTNGAGKFRAQAPAGENIYAIIGGRDYADASFTGISGLDSPLRVEQGALFGVPTWEVYDLEQIFKGCPGFDIGGGNYIVGVVGLYESLSFEDGTYDTFSVASVEVLPASVESDTGSTDTDPIPGCYLDEEGEAYDPDATMTGPSGWFAVGGVPEGLNTLVVSFPVTDTAESRTVYPVWMPQGGVVPRWPAWVEIL